MSEQPINISKESLVELIDRIGELDEQLGTSASAGKTKLRNELVKANDESVKKLATGIISKIGEVPDGEARHGVYFALLKQLDDVFGKPADKFLTDKVAEGKTDGETLSDEDRAKVFDERKAAYQQAKMVYDVLVVYKHDVSDIVMPEPTRGSVGPKVREISKFTLKIDGTPLPDDKQSLTAVAELLGYDSASALKAALKEEFKVELDKAGLAKSNGWNVTLKGKTFEGVRNTPLTETETAAA